MSSTNNNSSSRPISVKPTTSTATPTSSSSSSPPSSAATELSQEQWLDLLRVLPHNSLINLRVALRQYLDENGLSNEELTAAAAATPAATIPILSSNNNNSSNSQANVHLIQPRRTILPAASTLVPSAPLSLDEMPQNSYGTDRYTNLLRQSLKLPPLLKSVAATTASAIDAHNGLDTLAAAALASTNSEVSWLYEYLHEKKTFNFIWVAFLLIRLIDLIAIYNLCYNTSSCECTAVFVPFCRCPIKAQKFDRRNFVYNFDFNVT